MRKWQLAPSTYEKSTRSQISRGDVSKTCLRMWPKFIRIVRPGCDIFIRAEMNRVERVYLPFWMFFISLRVISYARNIISALAGVNLTFVMHVQCSMNAFIRPEYLKLLWGLFILLSVSLSLCNMSERLHPPLIWDAGQIRGPFIVYFTLELFWSRWRQGAAFFPFPFLSLSFFFLFLRQRVCLLHALSLNNALFEQCARNSGYRRARRIDFYHLLFPVILLTLLFH